MLRLTRSFDTEVRRGLGYRAPMCAAFVKKWLEMIAQNPNADPHSLDPTEVTRAQQAYANRPRGGDSKRAFWVNMAGLNVRWNPNEVYPQSGHRRDSKAPTPPGLGHTDHTHRAGGRSW